MLFPHQEIQVTINKKNTRKSSFSTLILIKTKNYLNKNNMNIKYYTRYNADNNNA